MKKTCLNCKFEPDWSKWSTGEYARCHGSCKWDSSVIQKLPSVIRIERRSIVRYSDDSGVETRCPTWEKK